MNIALTESFMDIVLNYIPHFLNINPGSLDAQCYKGYDTSHADYYNWKHTVSFFAPIIL